MVQTSTRNLCFEQKYETQQNFSSEIFHFLVVKFSIYLNRRVFIIHIVPKKDSNQSAQSLCLGNLSKSKFSHVIAYYQTTLIILLFQIRRMPPGLQKGFQLTKTYWHTLSVQKVIICSIFIILILSREGQGSGSGGELRH